MCKRSSFAAPLAVLSSFLVALIAVPAATLAGDRIVVTTTIQAAVDAARPGDTIVVPPGTYPESVLVNKSDITIVGNREAVIDAGFRIGVRVGAGTRTVVDGVRLCPPLTVSNFALKGLTIKNARFAGVFLIGVDGFRLTRTRYLDDPVYGPFPVCSRKGLIDLNTVEGGNAAGPDVSIDAGIYVGDSDRVTVRKNVVTNYAIGIEIENTSNAIVRDNALTGNTAGILAVVLPGLDMPSTDNILIERNQVIRNNLPNPVPFDPGPDGDPVGLIPTGTGILNVGGDRVVIRDNRIIGNDSLGVAIVQNPFADADPRIEPNPDRNQVRDNVILRNGRSPDPVRATTPGADIAYDGTGVGTCFAENVFKTEFPDGITASFPCLDDDDDDDDDGDG